MKKIPILALLLALTLWALPAKAQVVLPFSLTPKAAAKVTILPSTVSINDGATRQLTARVQNAQGEPVIGGPWSRARAWFRWTPTGCSPPWSRAPPMCGPPTWSRVPPPGAR